ncbi:MAG TPA: hypothetical protein VHA07_01445 [Devosia sp.]|nr:hypothetical protein [Devosia sp.]
MVTSEVTKEVNKVLRQQLGAIGFDRAEIFEERDHDGESILKVVIHYRKISNVIDPTPTFSLARLVKDAIRPLGEERFPHFTHLFPEDQDLKVA